MSGIVQSILEQILNEQMNERKALLTELFVHGVKEDQSYIIAFHKHVFIFKDEDKNKTVPIILSTLSSIWKDNPAIINKYFIDETYKRQSTKIFLEHLQRIIPDIFVGKFLGFQQTLYIYNFGEFDSLHSPYIQQLLRQLDINDIIDNTIGMNGLRFISNEQIKSLPDIGYHGTTSKHLTSIIRHGIRIGHENNHGKIEHTSLIFFSTNTLNALKHAIRTSSLRNSLPVVIEFKINNKYRITQDFDMSRYTGVKDELYNHIDVDIPKRAISNKPFSLSKNKGIYALIGSVHRRDIVAVWIPKKDTKHYFPENFIRVLPKEALTELGLFY